MSAKASPMLDDVAKLLTAAWIELPVAAAHSLMAKDGRAAVRQAGWKAYEAWVSLANDAANELYANRAFGEVVGRGLGAALQVRRVAGAAAAAVFGNLWPAIGLPTESAVAALRDDVISLRQEVRVLGAELGAERSEEDREGLDDYAAARDAEAQSAAAAMIWNGYRPKQPRVRRGRKEGKKSVAL